MPYLTLHDTPPNATSGGSEPGIATSGWGATRSQSPDKVTVWNRGMSISGILTRSQLDPTHHLPATQPMLADAVHGVVRGRLWPSDSRMFTVAALLMSLFSMAFAVERPSDLNNPWNCDLYNPTNRWVIASDTGHGIFNRSTGSSAYEYTQSVASNAQVTVGGLVALTKYTVPRDGRYKFSSNALNGQSWLDVGQAMNVAAVTNYTTGQPPYASYYRDCWQGELIDINLKGVFPNRVNYIWIKGQIDWYNQPSQMPNAQWPTGLWESVPADYSNSINKFHRKTWGPVNNYLSASYDQSRIDYAELWRTDPTASRPTNIGVGATCWRTQLVAPSAGTYTFTCRVKNGTGNLFYGPQADGPTRYSHESNGNDINQQQYSLTVGQGEIVKLTYGAVFKAGFWAGASIGWSFSPAPPQPQRPSMPAAQWPNDLWGYNDTDYTQSVDRFHRKVWRPDGGYFRTEYDQGDQAELWRTNPWDAVPAYTDVGSVCWRKQLRPIVPGTYTITCGLQNGLGTLFYGPNPDGPHRDSQEATGTGDGDKKFTNYTYSVQAGDAIDLTYGVVFKAGFRAGASISIAFTPTTSAEEYWQQELIRYLLGQLETEFGPLVDANPPAKEPDDLHSYFQNAPISTIVGKAWYRDGGPQWSGWPSPTFTYDSGNTRIGTLSWAVRYRPTVISKYRILFDGTNFDLNVRIDGYDQPLNTSELILWRNAGQELQIECWAKVRAGASTGNVQCRISYEENPAAMDPVGLHDYTWSSIGAGSMVGKGWGRNGQMYWSGGNPSMSWDRSREGFIGALSWAGRYRTDYSRKYTFRMTASNFNARIKFNDEQDQEMPVNGAGIVRMCGGAYGDLRFECWAVGGAGPAGSGRLDITYEEYYPEAAVPVNPGLHEYFLPWSSIGAGSMAGRIWGRNGQMTWYGWNPSMSWDRSRDMSIGTLSWAGRYRTTNLRKYTFRATASNFDVKIKFNGGPETSLDQNGVVQWCGSSYGDLTFECWAVGRAGAAGSGRLDITYEDNPAVTVDPAGLHDLYGQRAGLLLNRVYAKLWRRDGQPASDRFNPTKWGFDRGFSTAVNNVPLLTGIQPGDVGTILYCGRFNPRLPTRFFFSFADMNFSRNLRINGADIGIPVTSQVLVWAGGKYGEIFFEVWGNGGSGESGYINGICTGKSYHIVPAGFPALLSAFDTGSGSLTWAQSRTNNTGPVVTRLVNGGSMDAIAICETPGSYYFRPTWSGSQTLIDYGVQVTVQSSVVDSQLYNNTLIKRNEYGDYRAVTPYESALRFNDWIVSQNIPTNSVILDSPRFSFMADIPNPKFLTDVAWHLDEMFKSGIYSGLLSNVISSAWNLVMGKVMKVDLSEDALRQIDRLIGDQLDSREDAQIKEIIESITSLINSGKLSVLGENESQALFVANNMQAKISELEAILNRTIVRRKTLPVLELAGAAMYMQLIQENIACSVMGVTTNATNRGRAERGYDFVFTRPQMDMLNGLKEKFNKYYDLCRSARYGRVKASYDWNGSQLSGRPPGTVTVHTQWLDQNGSVIITAPDKDVNLIDRIEYDSSDRPFLNTDGLNVFNEEIFSLRDQYIAAYGGKNANFQMYNAIRDVEYLAYQATIVGLNNVQLQVGAVERTSTGGIVKLEASSFNGPIFFGIRTAFDYDTTAVYSFWKVQNYTRPTARSDDRAPVMTIEQMDAGFSQLARQDAAMYPLRRTNAAVWWYVVGKPTGRSPLEHRLQVQNQQDINHRLKLRLGEMRWLKVFFAPRSGNAPSGNG